VNKGVDLIGGLLQVTIQLHLLFVLLALCHLHPLAV